MPQFEYLNLKITGSKGCLHPGTLEEMSWNHIRLITTKNGITSVQHLAGGIERMEEHFNKQLNHYQQQGWEPIRVESPIGRSENHHFKNSIYCLLKRPVDLESSIRSKPLSRNSPQISSNLSISA